MSKFTDTEKGYIVFEDSGTSPISYGACEKWFPTYTEATDYAMGIVRKRVNELKNHIDCNNVIVYEASEELLHESHSIPSGRVVFYWGNYNLKKGE